jgi:sortase A
VVFVGVTESNLNRGAAWIDGTAPLGQQGNAGLAAHRDGYFRALRHIRVGDRIEMQTLQRTTTYVVDQILIVEPKNVQVLAPSNENRLTLVTCYPFYMIGPAPKRFIVRALAADTRVSAPAPS